MICLLTYSKFASDIIDSNFQLFFVGRGRLSKSISKKSHMDLNKFYLLTNTKYHLLRLELFFLEREWEQLDFPVFSPLLQNHTYFQQRR